MPKKDFKRFTVTAALIYANGPIHIGHLAGSYLPADIYVRYLRSNNKDVVFISGADEHGIPITMQARNEGITPKKVVDKYYPQIKESFERFGISFDIYSRTSNQSHHETAANFFTNLYNKGIFTEKESEQYFDESTGQFLADRYIVGICPNCNYENAYGDQCERCGTSLSPEELGDPRSTLSGNKPIKKSTKHWYLPLDKIQPKIEEYINSHQEWKINVLGQCNSWLKQGLHLRAMTRDLEWGVKVPLPDAQGKVLYVWFDAPIGYITFTKELGKQQNFDWEKYWKDEKTKLVHFMGKDNIVFHCIIFPGMLMEHGDYILADNVPANEFMNLEGDKISTSRNWAVWLHEYLDEFPGKEDVMRYVLCANAPEAKDNDFTWKDFQAKNNNELVANYGNFVNRVSVLTHKYFDGKVPNRHQLVARDKELIEGLASFPQQIGASIEQFKFREALAQMMDIARAGNKYLADTEPWKLFKTDPQRVKTILNLSLQVAANLTILSSPFLPFTAQKLSKILNLKNTIWKQAGSENLLNSGHQLGTPELLFDKIEDDVVENQIQKLKSSNKINGSGGEGITPINNEITFDEFQKLDMRIGTIIKAEKVPKSKKLLKLQVDTGIDQRVVVSGIGENFEPQSIIGQQVTILVNLVPRKIMGIESQGMILMAEDQDGSLRMLNPSQHTANGSTIS
ncbi:MAG: methionine--tRNA ligase [Bacteroidetes bacterium]|nr:methionine--tRNA ligase [Bacteroidota bacterium]